MVPVSVQPPTPTPTPTSLRLDLAGVKDPLAEERDGVSFGPVLRGEQEALDDPELHRVAVLVEKPVGGVGVDSGACWLVYTCALVGVD